MGWWNYWMVLKKMKMRWVAMKVEGKKGRMKWGGFVMILSLTIFSLFTLLLLARYTLRQSNGFDNGGYDFHPFSSFSIFAWKPIFGTSDLPRNVMSSQLLIVWFQLFNCLNLVLIEFLLNLVVILQFSWISSCWIMGLPPLSGIWSINSLSPPARNQKMFLLWCLILWCLIWCGLANEQWLWIYGCS